MTGSDGGTFSATLSGLAPGTNYVFQAYAIVSGTGQYSSEEETFYAGSPMVFKTQGATKPAVDKDWLELGSAKDGSQYVVSTTYAGSERRTTPSSTIPL